MDMFIDSFHPFSLVEERSFKKLLRWIPGYVPPSRKTVSGSMLEEKYHNVVEGVKQKILEAETLCITLDIWTSRATESYVAVTGTHTSFGCCQFEGTHTSENIAKEIQRLLTEWNLQQKVNFAISDNAYNMKKAIKNILGLKHHGCYAHTINLIVNDGLKLIKSEIDVVKKIVSYFRRSVTASEKLQKNQLQIYGQTKKLLQDIDTRWNSTFYMVQRFVELEDAIKMTMSVLETNLAPVTPEMWKILKQLCLILKPFENITNSISGESYLTGSLVIVLTRCLNESCSKILLRKDLLSIIRKITEVLKSSINDRFSNVERSETFGISTLMDPRFKLQGFSNIENANFIKGHLQQIVVNIIEETLIAEFEVLPEPSIEDTDEYNPWFILSSLVGTSSRQSTPMGTAIKEIDMYLADDVLPMKSADGTFNCPMEWWNKHKHAYPNLAKQLKTQVTSVEEKVKTLEEQFVSADDKYAEFNDRKRREKNVVVQRSRVE
ncbi:zinc finger BED domain-containing protein 4-like [Ctenocephalides felis]|uniref:zinc finger BED domain-containing protein 4-like n=1 Tax=Ctenocephalides felis TaxID=7515 RepID=UPI000E6E39F8|nr:zinc finger BED domain-containing protein 4-like [Ctenocephalides felis]